MSKFGVGTHLTYFGKIVLLGAVPGAHYSAYDGETGGPWDDVQMGFDGRCLFGKLSFTF